MSTQSSRAATSQTNGVDERLVRGVLDRVYAAWAANDADAFVEPYTEDATAQLPGSYLPSRDAIHATTRSLDTWVLSKQSGSWRVEAFHSSPANSN